VAAAPFLLAFVVAVDIAPPKTVIVASIDGIGPSTISNTDARAAVQRGLETAGFDSVPSSSSDDAHVLATMKEAGGSLAVRAHVVVDGDSGWKVEVELFEARGGSLALVCDAGAVARGAASIAPAIEAAAKTCRQPTSTSSAETPLIASATVALRPPSFTFAGSSAEVTPRLEPLLTSYVDLLKNRQDRIRLVGHADTGASAAKELKLSFARAQAIAVWFIKHGIDANRIDIVGDGNLHPLAASTAQGRVMNNRVDVEHE
jgi:outer membrane protein OmpA-like peptidoglycan-associated protein